MGNIGIMELIVLMIILVVLLLPVALCYNIARTKSRSGLRWALLGLVFGYIALVVLVFLKAPGEGAGRKGNTGT